MRLVFAFHKAFNNVISNHWARRMVLPIKIHLPKRIEVKCQDKEKNRYYAKKINT